VNIVHRFVLVLASLLALSGCAAMMSTDIDKAESLYQQKKYSEALKSYRQVAAHSLSSGQRAEARYSMALIQASPDNPQKNYAQAIESFEEFIKLYPDHEKASEALTWKNTLKLLLDEKRECEQLKKNIEQLKKLDISMRKNGRADDLFNFSDSAVGDIRSLFSQHLDHQCSISRRTGPSEARR
jgi:outer membrane protein assembly factor BamD (BamD/ComL family)